ncbi:MAG: FAD-dependent monooxygenase [Allorhizobium sp.]
MTIETAAIVGAGVAGLTAALALARHGIRCEIFEQAPQLAEVGAGLQISPNASRILAVLGVLDELEAQWHHPQSIRLVSGLNLSLLAAVPAGDFARKRWHAPYGVVHRATLQQALLQAVLRNPLCQLNLDCRMESAQAVVARTGKRPDLLVGADGAWSSLREQIPAAPSIDFSGNIAWRFTVPFSAAPKFLDPQSVTAYLGPSTHLVCYPLKEIAGFNIVAIAAGMDPGQTWGVDGDPAQRSMLVQQFSRWNPEIRALLQKAENPNFWPLYQATEGSWQNGRDTVLIGDAAHAMMPFAAQGAAMAIEDAFELAGSVASMALPQALTDFETRRKARVAKVRARGAFNKFAYHARGPIRIGRDLVLSLRPPHRLAADLDWLFSYQAQG